MRKSLIITVILLFTSSIVHADDDKYNICYIKGYFAGEGDKFMHGLASQIADEKGLMNDPPCISAHKSAFSFGAKFAVTGKYSSEQEQSILQYASTFRKRVNSAVIKLIE
jgi:hypothetical protein